uniref:Receptor expression-enhancing protein n=1 Tax=Glossina brevipalpis TaxID=37001 RepID=A0A1A9X136_9MUSC
MVSPTISRFVVLFFGTLHPAYASYKVVRTNDVKEYTELMMHWIVYALFTCVEAFTDIFISWFPFYYQLKTALVLWLFSPSTKGSSTLCRKFLLPTLARHEQKIDEHINEAKERGIAGVMQMVSKIINYATNTLMQTVYRSRLGDGNHQEQMVTFSRSENDIYTENNNVRRRELNAIRKKSCYLRSSNTAELKQTDDDDIVLIDEVSKYEVSTDDEEITSVARMPNKKNKLEKARAKIACIESGTKIRRAKLRKPLLIEEGIIE